jgi:hypothetical protein
MRGCEKRKCRRTGSEKEKRRSNHREGINVMENSVL